jgi:hypothetical protein
LVPLATTRAAPVAVGGLVILAFGAHTLAAGLRQTSPGVHFAPAFEAESGQTRFVGRGYAEPSTVFYSERTWTMTDRDEELAQEIARPGPLVVTRVAREADPLDFVARPAPRWREYPVPAALAGGPGWKVSRFEGLNPGRSRWQTIEVWTRTAESSTPFLAGDTTKVRD